VAVLRDWPIRLLPAQCLKRNDKGRLHLAFCPDEYGLIIKSVFRDMSQIMINILSRKVKSLLKKILDLDLHEDEFQNFISPFLSADTSLVKFS